MWDIEITAPAGEAYTRLQEEFDERHVPKETANYTVTRRRHGEEPRAVEINKTINKPDEQQALQFRYLSKAAQNMMRFYEGDVTVALSADENTMTLRIEADNA